MIRKFILATVLLPLFSFAQSDTSGNIAEQRSRASVKIGLFGINELNYYGRRDSLKSSAFFPVIELWADKHFYFSAAPVFIHNNSSTAVYAGTVTSAGYMFRNSNWGGNSYISVPVYKQGSGLVQSRLRLQATTSFSRLTKILNFTLGGDLKYSDRVDFGATAGVDHLFRRQFQNKWILVFVPSAYVNAGTQQFSSTRYKQNGLLLLPPVQQQVTTQTNKFNMLSYEFSMPTVLAINKLQIIVNPAYVIPRNLVVVEGRPDLSERGENLFYVTAGIKCQLF